MQSETFNATDDLPVIRSGRSGCWRVSLLRHLNRIYLPVSASGLPIRRVGAPALSLCALLPLIKKGE